MVNVSAEAEIVKDIEKIHKEIITEIVRRIAEIEKYLEGKYHCDVADIESGNRYVDSHEEEYIDVPKHNLRVYAKTGDFEVVQYLKKLRLAAQDARNLRKAISDLPENPDDVAALAYTARTKVKSLMSTCSSDLAAMGRSEAENFENRLLIIVTDLTSIEKRIKELKAI